ncbi:MAG: hypothetical protein AB1758_36450 [Candidatus Eremiobacterota bacterium]
MALPYVWGTRSEELGAEYPCDRHLSHPDQAMFRAVSVEAGAPLVYRWLCQLRVAPYSYDWIDNLGRRSPRKLTPGLERLEVGQKVMTIFRLVEFEPDRHVTMVMSMPAAVAVFGQVALSYVTVPLAPERTRLLVKFLVRYPGWLPRSLMSRVLGWGDLIMMCKQLLTLKALAESTR